MPRTTTQSDERAESSSLTLVFSLPPAGLRRNHEANRYKANALKDAYSERIWAEWLGQKSPSLGVHAWKEPLDADVVWRQCGAGDTDNALASVKVIFDVLGRAPATKAGEKRVYLGIYDSDSQIRRICVERERVSKKAEECVIVRLHER